VPVQVRLSAPPPILVQINMKIKIQKNLANLITLTRILGVTLIFWVTPYKTNFWQLIAVSIFVLICTTDFLDGWVARKLNIVTNLGKILDPLADKILVLIFLPLLEMQVITSFPVFIILARELAIMALRIASAKDGTIIEAKLSGKIKTAITLPVCALLFARVPVTEVSNLPLILTPLNELRRFIFMWPSWVFNTLIWFTVLITVWSFLDYFGNFMWQKFVRKTGGNEKKAKRLLFAIIPNTFTTLNLICGIAAVFLAWIGFYHFAVLLVILGILFDAVDGSLARKLDAVSKFGAKLDSKADFVSFGIAPSIIIYKILSETNGMPLFWGIFLALTYYGAIQYRLSRFDKGGHSPYFEGLPSPIGASLVLIAAVSNLLSSIVFFVPILILVEILMISRIPYAHFEIASKKTFFKFLKIPLIIVLLLTMFNLLKVNYVRYIYIYEILFALICLYVLTPVFSYFVPTEKKIN
jgi:CDP-diacylglycerol--glycerol-3-phosphate 3-phosphatidyltransferase/CDP-diacylglycerol--serine O-phosphatidyltransferase